VIPVANTFVGHVKADRYQEAYNMTSPAFQASVTMKEFEEFCRRRNSSRAGPESLTPDRTKYPTTGNEFGVSEQRYFPLVIMMVKNEDGHWSVDEVMLLEWDDKMQLITGPQRKGTKKE
jgi:hypothetical protein